MNKGLWGLLRSTQIEIQMSLLWVGGEARPQQRPSLFEYEQNNNDLESGCRRKSQCFLSFYCLFFL